jgi:hypothetical protein
MGTTDTRVTCRPDADGWRCEVVVGEGDAATTHQVTVPRATLVELAPEATPDDLVATSFVFLLEREGRESILREFELGVIERYFPEYPAEIRRRLG